MESDVSRVPAIIAGIVLFGAVPLTAQSAGRVEAVAPLQNAEWRAIDSILKEAYPATGPGATAIVVRDGKVLYRGAAGMANIELGVPMRPDMVFPVFSVTKQFTGAAILMLADEGKLSLADPVTRFFPDFPPRYKTVRIEHLLAHTSGLPNYTDLPAYKPTVRNHVTKDELVALFRDEQFLSESGERWEYNNSGYVLLGAIIEKVSGMSHGAFLRTRIFKPLGMTSTYVYDEPDAIIPRRVAGYTKGPNGWKDAEYFSLTHGYAIGNVLTTVDDLARWDAAIEHQEILSRRSWERAFTSFTLNDSTRTGYSAGWFLGNIGRVETVEHAGNFLGGVASILRAPRERVFVAILTNADPPATDPEKLNVELAARVLGVSPYPARVQLTTAQLDEYVGKYLINDSNTRTITREGTVLYSQRSGGQRFEMYPIGDDQFYVPAAGVRLRFQRKNGRIVTASVVPRLGLAGPPARRVN